MQFQVPQNITMEDRIVWFLSPLQFGIIVIGWGLAFAVFTSSYIPSPINTGLGGLLAVITAIIAVGKFNDQPMYHFIKFIFAFIARPRTRIWHKEGGEVMLVKPKVATQEEQKKTVRKDVSHGDFARLAAVLDSRGKTGLPPKVTAKENL